SALVLIVAASAAVVSLGRSPAQAKGGAVREGASQRQDPPDGRYEDLLALFQEWRRFQKPRLEGGVPDYTPAAMAEQKRRLPDFQRRLQAIAHARWPVAQQVDWHLAR